MNSIDCSIRNRSASERPDMSMKAPLFIFVCLAITAISAALAIPEAKAPEAKVTPLFSKDLKDFAGKEGEMILVEYPPGSVDAVHRHNAHAFVYVLEGSIVMQLK